MTGTDLARQLGISQPHISNLELGRRDVSPGLALAIAAALCIPLPAILLDPDADDRAPDGHPPEPARVDGHSPNS